MLPKLLNGKKNNTFDSLLINFDKFGKRTKLLADSSINSAILGDNLFVLFANSMQLSDESSPT